eukprot:m.485395 g.485395  ORF g.485395 m.485395 type:complete len:1419 (+) comp23799_c0_seq1:249-4505(+)
MGWVTTFVLLLVIFLVNTQEVAARPPQPHPQPPKQPQHPAQHAPDELADARQATPRDDEDIQFARASSATASLTAPASTLYGPLACNNALDAAAGSDGSGVTWLAWSSPSSWPGNRVPEAGQDVVIPCGVAISLDQAPPATLGRIHVQGYLRLEDNGPWTLTAYSVLVEGRLYAGTPTNPITTKLEIVLTSAPGRADLVFDKDGFSNNVGEKVLAVAGGSVHLFGYPSACPTWTRLTAPVEVGATSFTIKGDLSSCWKAGDVISVASTDFIDWSGDEDQTESRTVVSAVAAGQVTTVTVSEPLAYSHFGGPQTVADVTFETSGEVLLESRNIIIRGAAEASGSFEHIGGHTMVFHTPTPQEVSGVEFVNMGQAGRLGRYPFHAHMCQSVGHSWTVRGLSIHDSNQRCVVVHGSMDGDFDDIVALRNKGHCFLLEDGVETGNVFDNNAVVGLYRPATLISNDESDDDPSGFWITNPDNTWRNNVGASCVFSGFWFELRKEVRGPSASLPQAQDVNPRHVLLGEFTGNVAHSCATHGMRTYPDGYRPRGGSALFSDLVSYKNRGAGLFLHNSDSIDVTNVLMSDNTLGVDLDRVEGCHVSDSTIIGESNNFGNPARCDDYASWANCRPRTSCRLPVQLENARSIPDDRYRPIFGVQLHQTPTWAVWDAIPASSVSNTRFAGFLDLGSDCRPAAALSVDDEPLNIFDARTQLSGIDVRDGSNPLWLDPSHDWPKHSDMRRSRRDMGYYHTGDGHQHIAIRDTTGEVVGSPGFVTANNPSMIDDALCAFNAAYNAYTCPGTCFRTVYFDYDINEKQPAPRTFVSGHSITIRWTDSNGNNKEDVLDPLIDDDEWVFYSTNLLAGNTYTVVVDIPEANIPDHVHIGYRDGQGCGDDVKLVLQSSLPGKAFEVLSGVQPVPCDVTASTSFSTFSYGCENGVDTTTLHLNQENSDFWGAEVRLVDDDTSVCFAMDCAVVSFGADWTYSDRRQTETGFESETFAETGWSSGTAPFGYGFGHVATPLDAGPTNDPTMTAYFRTTVNAQDVACIQSLTAFTHIDDGIILYLNGEEIERYNMHWDTRIPVTYATQAQWEVYWTPGIDDLELDNDVVLREGANTLAVEVHSIASARSPDLLFDLAITARMDTGCLSNPPGQTTSGPTTPSSKLRVGALSLTSSNTVVPIASGYTNPVVVIGGVSHLASDPVVLGLSHQPNADSFTVRAIEFPYSDGIHNTPETSSWLVAESGSHDAGTLDAGIVDGVTHQWKQVTFSSPMASVPVVLVTPHDLALALVVRVTSVTTTGFRVKLQRQELDKTIAIPATTISYMALTTRAAQAIATADGATRTVSVSLRTSVRHTPVTVEYGATLPNTVVACAMQSTFGGDTSWAAMAAVTTTSVNVFSAEEKSKDQEIGHAGETIGIVAFSG